MVNKTYANLKDEFDRKVEELRKGCDHPEVSDWRKECWAVGHTTGFEVKVCEICRETVARRTCCANCGRLVEEDSFERGDGTRRPASEIFCPECQEKWEEFVRNHPRSGTGKTVEVGKHLTDAPSVKGEEDLSEGLHYMKLHRRFLNSSD